MKEVKSSDAVLYYALKDAMAELKDSILNAYDDMYNISPDERNECLNIVYNTSTMLEMAMDVAAEIESYSDFGDEEI